MDRRNGGDHQAPPRPPKLLPRIHRPRAPEPMEVLNDLLLSRRNDRVDEIAAGLAPNVRNETRSGTVVTGTSSTPTRTLTEAAPAIRTTTPRCTNSDQIQQHLSTHSALKPQLEKSKQLQQLEQLNSITTSSTTISTAPLTTTTTTTTTTTNTVTATTTTTLTAPKTAPRREHPLANFSVRTGSSSSNSTTSSNSTIVTDIITNNNSNNNDGSNSNSRTATGISGPNTFVIHNNLLSDPNILATCQDYENYQIYHLTYLPQRPESLSLNSLSSSASASAVTAANSFTRRRPQPGTPGADATWRITGNNNSIGSFFSHFQQADNASASPVTLAQPRPESQRLTNEYVDTPLRTPQHVQNNASRAQQENNQAVTHHILLLPLRDRATATEIGGGTTATTVAANLGVDGTDGFIHSQNQKPQLASDKVRTPTPTPTTTTTTTATAMPPPLTRDNVTPAHQQQQPQQLQQLPPITKQPASTKCKSSPAEIIQIANASPTNSPNGSPIIITGGLNSTNSITCPRCGLCRCEQCKSSGLPQKWLCKKSCLCSAETVMDYTTCLCCAKAIFYHCATQGDMDDEEDYVDDPCSCTPRKRLQRWGWLGALSLVLPCLWFYWPMRGCTWLCEKCYNRFAGRGCRCQHNNTTSNMLPTRPLATHGGTSADSNSNIPSDNTTSHLASVTSKLKGGHAHHRHHQHQHQHQHHHHHHHHGDSVASRMLRKGDLTPKKRLLDTNIDYV